MKNDGNVMGTGGADEMGGGLRETVDEIRGAAPPMEVTQRIIEKVAAMPGMSGSPTGGGWRIMKWSGIAAAVMVGAFVAGEGVVWWTQAREKKEMAGGPVAAGPVAVGPAAPVEARGDGATERVGEFAGAGGAPVQGHPLVAAGTGSVPVQGHPWTGNTIVSGPVVMYNGPAGANGQTVNRVFTDVPTEAKQSGWVAINPTPAVPGVVADGPRDAVTRLTWGGAAPAAAGSDALMQSYQARLAQLEAQRAQLDAQRASLVAMMEQLRRAQLAEQAGQGVQGNQAVAEAQKRLDLQKVEIEQLLRQNQGLQGVPQEQVQQLAIALQQQPQGGQLQIQGDQIRVLNDGGAVRAVQAPAPQPANGSMTALRNIVGQQIQMQVLGSSNGTIWGGNGVYTDDSPVGVAAVHAGILKDGESARLNITILPGQANYVGLTQNGVTSSAYGKWDGSYRIDGKMPGGVVQQNAFSLPFAESNVTNNTATFGGMPAGPRGGRRGGAGANVMPDVTVTPAPAVTSSLETVRDAAVADATPVKTGSISGKVVDKNGKPAANAQVRFVNAIAGVTSVRTSATPRRTVFTTTTNDKGEFVLKDVPVGSGSVVQASLTTAEGLQRGNSSAPVEVKEGQESKMDDAIKLQEASPRATLGGFGGG